MLIHLSIRNYAIVDALDMEFEAGMTVLTGETGAGKSIMLDALGLCLGDRADAGAIAAGSERAEIAASFDVAGLEAARHWLFERNLDSVGDCILRRSLNREGRSRAYINGQPSTLQDCAQLGALLIDIHHQHSHQSLLRRETQRKLLDAFAGQAGAAAELERLASDWLRLRRQVEALAGSGDERNAHIRLLAYQVEELEQIDPQPGEVEELEARQRRLANAERIMLAARQAMDAAELHEDGSRRALALLQAEHFEAVGIDNVRALLDSAAIQLGEARAELREFLDRMEVDPEALREVEARLDTLYGAARKHRARAEELPAIRQRLVAELAEARAGEGNIEALRQRLDGLAGDWRAAAAELGAARAAGARELTGAVQAQLAQLAMRHCRFEVALSPREAGEPHPHGLEHVEFRIATSPDAKLVPLAKIASGGELSRISLAIAVVAADVGGAPAVVFDEVDVGIGGAVAEVVGRLLRKLSARAQVLCVTHLPQVASLGHHHLRVSKPGAAGGPRVRLRKLAVAERVEEVARMLGGIELTDKTRAHAEEMLANA